MPPTSRTSTNRSQAAAATAARQPAGLLDIRPVRGDRVTAALVAAGTSASTLWFLSVLRKLGLKLRFAPLTRAAANCSPWIRKAPPAIAA